MSPLRYCRPCLRLYYRNPRLALGAIAFVAIFSFMHHFDSIQNLFSSSKSDSEYQSNDIFISSKEYKFELTHTSSPSLFGSAQCLLMDLDYRSEAILKYQKDLGELQCSGDRITSLGGGVLHVKGVGLQDVSFQAIQTAKTSEDEGFSLGDRMSVVTAQVQLTPGELSREG